MALMKGNGILSLRDFVIDRFGIPEWNSVVAAVPRSDEAVLRSVVRAGWYDRGLQARLLRVVAARRGHPSVAEDFGRYEAEHDFTTSYRWFLRLLKPSFAVRNMDLFWRRTEDTGYWRSSVDDENIVARLYDWGIVDPLLCQYLRSYLERTLEFFTGNRTVIIHPQCRANGDQACVFRTKCRLDGQPSYHAREISKEDVADIAFELMDYTGLDALADAVIELLRSQLSSPWVALWVQMEKSGGLTLVRSDGNVAVGVPFCFMLETRGRVVGKLEAELPNPEQDAEIIGELLPCFSSALYGILASSLARGDSSQLHVPEREDKGHLTEAAPHVGAAAKRWQLSARQVKVLEFVVAGQTNKEIAGALGCSEGNVEAHVSKILKKSRSGNRTTLVRRLWSEP